MSLDLSSLIEKAEVKISDLGDWRNKSVRFTYENTQILVYLGLHINLPETDEYPVYKIYKMVGEKREVIFDTSKLVKGHWANISEKDGKIIIAISTKYATYVKMKEEIPLDDLIIQSYSVKKTSVKSEMAEKSEKPFDAESVKDFIAKALSSLNVSEINVGEILIDEQGVRIQNLSIFFDK